MQENLDLLQNFLTAYYAFELSVFIFHDEVPRDKHLSPPQSGQ